jgi:hypothetical protein
VELVRLSKIPVIVGCKRFIESRKLNTPGVEEVAVNLVGAAKHPMVVGHKIFMRAEDFLRDEGDVQLAGNKWRMVP